MGNEAKVTAAPTIAEKMGIKYKEVDGLYYPMWNESDVNEYATVGKYGHRWMTMLMEHDRYLYNKYFLDGTLIWKAKDMEDYCLNMHDSMVEKLRKARAPYYDTSDSMLMIARIQEIEATVEEVINGDILASINYNKCMRLMNAKKNIASRQAETQRMEG